MIVYFESSCSGLFWLLVSSELFLAQNTDTPSS
jgi:hypothetical protein